MSIQILNTQSGLKEIFAPRNAPEVKMYCCGPTVYDLLHVGNFRGAIFFNLVRNWLEHRGYKVKYIYNYTDVDDKIINRAKERRVPPQELAQKYIVEFEADFARLGLRRHDANPRVSETMPGIVAMIQELIDKGQAYATENGDVWYSVKSFPQYGKLSHRNPDDLRSGERIEPDPHKRDSLDFALWKHAKEGEPFWPAPWGKGRPGWHIECSAMARQYLGEQVDIHGGGLDLLFPHHENEIAQSEGCHHKEYVKYWMHNNMINFAGAKMSKSLGNVFTARSFMDTYHPEILKYLMLASHYRSVTDLSEANIEHAVKALARIYSCLALAEQVVGSTESLTEAQARDLNPEWAKLLSQAEAEIATAMDDDFATPQVMARLFEVVRQFNADVKSKWIPGRAAAPKSVSAALLFRNFVRQQGQWMALYQESPAGFLQTLDNMLLLSLKISRETVEALVQDRWAAKQARDFPRADQLRDQLVKMGISVMDTATGSQWEVAK